MRFNAEICRKCIDEHFSSCTSVHDIFGAVDKIRYENIKSGMRGSDKYYIECRLGFDEKDCLYYLEHVVSNVE